MKVNFTTAAVVEDSEICGQVPAGSDDHLSAYVSPICLNSLSLSGDRLAFVVVSAHLCGCSPQFIPKRPVSLATRTAVIVGDVLVLVITWTKTAQAYREARRMKIRAPLTTIVFRDGAINEYGILYCSSLMASQQGQFVSCTSESFHYSCGGYRLRRFRQCPAGHQHS